jgi:hypothetical protein
MTEWIQQPVMVPVVPPLKDVSDVVPLFRSLLDTYKNELRLEVLEELIGECYGPQALLQGRSITDVADFKEWLEAKLIEESA